MKKTNITLSIALAAVFSSSVAFAEAEVTGKIVHESAKFTTTGTTIGAAAAHDKDVMKTETSARIYIDGEIDEVNEGSTYHVELNLMRDSKGIGKYDSNESYTQRDALREAYVDTTVDDWSIRAGKQQVVWGTADGMKLLDAINPTDYSEMAQNQMEDSRIPVWMINAETDAADGGSYQVVLSEAKSSNFAGLGKSSSAKAVHTNGDRGHAFIMKGVDSITGRTNGFLNAASDIGATAAVFNGGFSTLASFDRSTVGEFFNNSNIGAFMGGDGSSNGANCSGDNDNTTADATSAACMGAFTAQAYANAGTTTNVLDAATVDATKTNFAGTNNEGGTNPGSVFAYMTDATFATFNSFSGANTEYRVKHEDAVNTGLRYKNSTSNGVNYSINYMNHYDTNPYVDMHWEDSYGVTLNQTVTPVTGDGSEAAQGEADQVGRVYNTIKVGVGATGVDSQGVAVGFVSGVGASLVLNSPTLVFEEKLNKINSIGGSFDTAIETEKLGPVVLRGEVLYNQDEMTPVVDRNKLAYGDLPGGLKMTKSDTFKYVLGADITALTNMMISGQFIQIRNLDYIDNKTNSEGVACGVKVNCGVYTSDMATMHMSNGLQKAEKNKEFYSLFLSKPFGASGEHRWNNIFMFEENGGKWNRLDAEFSIDDDTQATVEYNKYWGDANTQFGQLEKSSNIQVGVKYSF